MIIAINRELLTQAVIVVGTCVGAFVFFVEPRVERLAEVEAEIVEIQARTSGVDYTAVERLAMRASDIHERVAQIDSRSRLALDSAGLFGRIMDLARFYEVEVKSLKPQVQAAGGAVEVGPQRDLETLIAQ